MLDIERYITIWGAWCDLIHLIVDLDPLMESCNARDVVVLETP
jgi:hypothetical protein